MAPSKPPSTACAEMAEDIQTGLIVCGLRNLEPAGSLDIARAAGDFMERGVVAVDLAGAESGNPPSGHQAAFDYAANANLPITIHAGETFGAASIHQAIHTCHARRIGHGTRLLEDPDVKCGS